MPKYDFSCMNCDKTVELHAAFNSMDIPVCETCGYKMVKVYTPPSVHFKGGGWGGSGS